MQKFIETLTETTVVNNNKMVKSDCIAIQFYVPTGGNDVSINGLVLSAGGTYSVSNDYPYIDRTQYELVFQTGAGTNVCIVSKTVLKNERNLIGLD